MFDIIVIGSATKDVFLDVNKIKPIKTDQFTTGQALAFGLGSKTAIDKMTFASGGGGTNVAVTFARQGFKTACVGVVGQDFNGQEVVEELKRESVDVSYFQTHNDDHTAYSVILVSESGERTILSYKGEGQHFNVGSIPFDKFETRWLSLNSLGGHIDLFEKCVEWASANSVKLVTNPGTKELEQGLEKIKPLLAKCEIVTMSQEEAALLTGLDYSDKLGLFKFMDDIVEGIFVMTNGSEGVSVSDGEKIYTAGVPNSPVVERTGAGDSFFSGFVSEYMRSGDIVKSIQLGTANATSVVQYYGSKEGILRNGDSGEYPLVEVKIEPK